MREVVPLDGCTIGSGSLLFTLLRNGAGVSHFSSAQQEKGGGECEGLFCCWPRLCYQLRGPRARNVGRQAHLRASANRGEVDPFAGRARDARSSGELLKLPNEGVYPHARDPIVLHRAHLGAVLRLAAGKRSEPSAWLPPLSRNRSSSLREVGSGVGVRLRLLEDRRRIVFGHYFTPSVRRVDCSGGDGHTARTGA